VDDFKNGIPKLAALLNVDETFGIFRAFLPQTSRILVCRMIKLSQLVDRQRELDNIDAANSHACKLNTIKSGGENDQARAELDEELSKGIKDYRTIKIINTSDLIGRFC
jgi:hypothetical protein